MQEVEGNGAGRKASRTRDGQFPPICSLCVRARSPAPALQGGPERRATPAAGCMMTMHLPMGDETEKRVIPLGR